MLRIFAGLTLVIISHKMKLKPIQLIHTAFCIAVLTFAAVTLFINKDKLIFSTKMANEGAMNLLFPLIGLISISIGIFMYNRMLAGINETDTFESKLVKYQTAFLVKCALFEAGALLNIVACFITGNSIFMLFAGISFLALLMSRPIKDRVIAELKLEYPDTESL
ncbi:MAG: hypothetical protein EOO96_11100 [Pedobacter sp.]|nr:MAG: hypothetical protein EOO96_11100 [Pedobacter sp.]